MPREWEDRKEVELDASAYGPPVADWKQARQALTAALGLTVEATEGDPVHCTPVEGLPPLGGVVDYATADHLGVRTPDALYRFLHGIHGGVMVAHHMFSECQDQAAVEQAWQAWLTQLFAWSAV